MTLAELLDFTRASVDDRRDVVINVHEVWGWTITMDESGFGVWRRQRQDLYECVSDLVKEICVRDDVTLDDEYHNA